MRRCECCGASLRKNDQFCPKCGEKCALPVKEPARDRSEEVIRVSSSDVVIMEFAKGEETEVKTPEQMIEEERAYQEDRDAPPPVTTAPAQAPEQPSQRRKSGFLWGGEEPEHKARHPLGMAAAVVVVGALMVLAVGLWSFVFHNTPLMLRLAERAVEAQNYASALNKLEALAVRDAENPEVYYQLCIAYRALDDDAKALAAAQLGYDHTGDTGLLEIVNAYTLGGNFIIRGEEGGESINSGVVRSEPADGEQALLAPVQRPPVTKAQLKISPMYEYADGFEGGLARVKQDGKWGFLDPMGSFAVPARYTETLYFTENLCAVKEGGKWGYIDRAGGTVIAPRFQNTLGFREGLAAVLENQKWGFIDKTGETLFIGYEGAQSFYEGLAAVKMGGVWGFLNQEGELVIPAAYDEVRGFCEGFAAVRKGSLWGYADTQGRMAIPLKYEEAYDFKGGVARVKSGGRFGYINYMDWSVSPFEWDEAYNFSEGLATVKNSGGYGYINRSGEIIIPPELEDVWSYREGLLPFAREGLWGYLDTQGNEIIMPQYLEAGLFYEGLAKVKTVSGGYGYINRVGAAVCVAEYDDGGICTNGMVAVMKNDKWGYLEVQKPS